MTRGADLPVRPSLQHEMALWECGWRQVAGIDEAGRGALAGPVCAAAVILPQDTLLLEELAGVRDSKLMSPAGREHWRPIIQAKASGWGVGFASAQEIDQLGILSATRLAAGRAMAGLQPDALLTDYLIFAEMDLPQSALVKGDRLSLSVAAASVLAKTSRDAHMLELDALHPGYGFAQHKGYGTQAHRRAMAALGACPEHRSTFHWRNSA